MDEFIHEFLSSLAYAFGFIFFMVLIGSFLYQIIQGI
jgi:hypothetical protein